MPPPQEASPRQFQINRCLTRRFSGGKLNKNTQTECTTKSQHQTHSLPQKHIADIKKAHSDVGHIFLTNNKSKEEVTVTEKQTTTFAE